MNAASDKRIIDLARSFPSLCDAQGIDPWEPEKFFWWATEDEDVPHRFYSAMFVLGVAMDKYRSEDDFSFYSRNIKEHLIALRKEASAQFLTAEQETILKQYIQDNLTHIPGRGSYLTIHKALQLLAEPGSSPSAWSYHKVPLVFSSPVFR